MSQIVYDNRAFHENRLYVKLDAYNRFSIPCQFYSHLEDPYRRYYVETIGDSVIFVKFLYELPLLKDRVRYHIPLRVTETLPYTPETIYECVKCKNGLQFIPTELKELP